MHDQVAVEVTIDHRAATQELRLKSALISQGFKAEPVWFPPWSRRRMNRTALLLRDKDGSVFCLNKNALVHTKIGCCELLQLGSRSSEGVKGDENNASKPEVNNGRLP